tara:strand:- start:34625 stop:35455 length:831 start_codon:yes stop_codon:yes gene_type:complete
MAAGLNRRWAKRIEGMAGFDRYRCDNINVDRYTPADLASSNKAEQNLLLFLHGGAYCLKTPNLYKRVLAEYCDTLKCIGILPDYRLSPEHPHPCGIEDCLNTYQNLLAQGYCPENIIILGDSAGGGLSLSVIQRVQRQMPAAAVLLSPAGDWSLQGASYFENEDRDPFFRLATFLFFRSLYLNGYSSTDPNVSPVYGDFSNFPPTLLLSSSTELMRDTAVLIDKNIRTAGGHSTLHITQNACHDYPLFDFLPEAKIAKQKIFSFCNAIFSKTALPD